MAHHANAKSKTWTARIPLWMDEELIKMRGPEEKESDQLKRALLLLITTEGETDG